jgi:uncharacterized membrane protein YcaP (DUF421 family)
MSSLVPITGKGRSERRHLKCGSGGGGNRPFIVLADADLELRASIHKTFNQLLRSLTQDSAAYYKYERTFTNRLEISFHPFAHIAEIFLRGTIVYLFLFVVLRILRREAGAISISDLLFVVLVADAAQNAMASEYKSITEGIILLTTIAFWNYFLDWLGYRFPAVRPLLRPAPLLLIKDGHIQRRNLRKEMITEEELIEELREQGVERVEEVKKSYLEGDGRISVIAKDSKDKKGKDEKPGTRGEPSDHLETPRSPESLSRTLNRGFTILSRPIEIFALRHPPI